jgi:hypothetical protein
MERDDLENVKMSSLWSDSELNLIAKINKDCFLYSGLVLCSHLLPHTHTYPVRWEIRHRKWWASNPDLLDSIVRSFSLCF